MEKVSLHSSLETVMESLESLRPRFEEVLYKHIGNQAVEPQAQPVQWMLGTISNIMMVYMSVVGSQLSYKDDAEHVKSITPDLLYATALALAVTTVQQSDVVLAYMNVLFSPKIMETVVSIRKALTVKEDSPAEILNNLEVALKQTGVDLDTNPR